MSQFNTQPAPRPTPNQIRLRAVTFADNIVQGGSPRNIAAIAAYGDCLRDPHYQKHRIPRAIEQPFYRALTAAANDEMMAFSSSLLDDEDRLTLLENEIAIMVSTMVEAARKAESDG